MSVLSWESGGRQARIVLLPKFIFDTPIAKDQI